MMRWPARRGQLRISKCSDLRTFGLFNLVHQLLPEVRDSVQCRSSLASASPRQDEQRRNETVGELIGRRPILRDCCIEGQLAPGALAKVHAAHLERRGRARRPKWERNAAAVASEHGVQARE